MEIINPLGLTAVEMAVQATKRGTVITSLNHTVFGVSSTGLTHASLQTTSETDRFSLSEPGRWRLTDVR